MTDLSKHMHSDHSLITLQVMTDEFHRGPGFWKFNLSLLQDDLFAENTKTFISDFFKFNTFSANPHIVRDSFKCSLRGYCIKYSSWKHRLNTLYENELIQENKKLNEEIVEDGETFSDIYVTLENKQRAREGLKMGFV